MTRILSRAAFAGALVATLSAPVDARAQERGANALGPLIAGLGTTARVLIVGAHPDDEVPGLTAYLSRGRQIRTALLSITRGEGGMNVIGAETNAALGLVRTSEALAARRVDGGEQYFTRAIDFGLAKTANEAIARWGAVEGGDAVLGDVVRIVRAFRPHVIIALGAGGAEDRDGQHRVAELLAREAVAAARDTVRFRRSPFGAPWTFEALYQVLPPTDSSADSANIVRIEVGEFAPLLGRSYAEVGAEGRARQRSQGAGVVPALGTMPIRLRRLAAPVPAESAAYSIFDGIDTTLAHIRRRPAADPLTIALDSLPQAIAVARASYRPSDPAASVPSLAALTQLAARVAARSGFTTRGSTYDPDAARSLEDLWRRAREALVLASGVAVEATAERETVARATPADSSDTLRVAVAVHNRGTIPIAIDGASMTGGPNIGLQVRAWIPPDSVWRGTITGSPRITTQAWWSPGRRLGDLYAVDVDGRPESEHAIGNESGALRVSVPLRIAGAGAVINVPVVFRPVEPGRSGERPVAVVPALTLRLDHAFEFARAGIPLVRPVRVTVQSAFATPRDVDVTLSVPPGLTVDSATRRIAMPPGGTTVVTYVLRGTPKADDYIVSATGTVSGEKYTEASATIAPDHIPPQRIYFPASMTLRGANVALPPRAFVGYVASVIDQTPRMLQELGIALTQIDPSSLTLPSTDLSRFTAIVVAPRTYETSPALLGANGRLFTYARNGGTVVVQYGRYEMEQPGALPFAITLGRPAQAVTEEMSEVRLLEPSSSVLSAPNRITGADFGRWTQDRAVFLPETFDPRWRAILEVSDSGEPPNRGALLVAPVGRGTYVYTTLSFFRQFPSANVGAARLFVNLLAPRATAPSSSGR